MINFCPECGKPFTPGLGSEGTRCEPCKVKR